jgi:hypothetical protein
MERAIPDARIQVEGPAVVQHQEQVESFTKFARNAEPRLRHALVAAYGPDVGREAAAEAIAYGWENWERLQSMDNPIGYLYRQLDPLLRTDCPRANRRMVAGRRQPVD